MKNPTRLDSDRLLQAALPVAVFCAALGLWEAVVRLAAIAPFVLPAPSLIAATLVTDWPTLSDSLVVTLRTTFEALVVAVFGGVALAVLFAQWKWVERSFFPFAVVMQVTPIIAIAPLLLVYLDAGTAVLVCAFLVAFFPILANMTLGLASADHNLVDLFDLYGASRWQQLVLLRLPAALPHFLGGLRIAGGLALIGAIVAEIAAGSPGQGAGLAYRIVESSFRLNIPRMFAALVLISATGIVIFLFFTGLTHLLLKARGRGRDERRVGPAPAQRSFRAREPTSTRGRTDNPTNPMSLFLLSSEFAAHVLHVAKCRNSVRQLLFLPRKRAASSLIPPIRSIAHSAARYTGVRNGGAMDNAARRARRIARRRVGG